MKLLTAGLKVRFFNVNIANGHRRTRKSTGNTFTGNWVAANFGMAVMKSLEASR